MAAQHISDRAGETDGARIDADEQTLSDESGDRRGWIRVRGGGFGGAHAAVGGERLQHLALRRGNLADEVVEIVRHRIGHAPARGYGAEHPRCDAELVVTSEDERVCAEVVEFSFCGLSSGVVRIEFCPGIR